MAGLLADLSLRISANTAELNTGLKKASDSVNKFSKNGNDSSKKWTAATTSIKGAFSNMASSITDQAAGISGIFGDLAGNVTESISAVRGLTKGMGAFKVALASTGIGLLVIALGSVVTYVTQFAEGQELLNKVLGGAKAVLGNVLQLLGSFGQALVQLVQGDLTGAWNTASGAVKEFGSNVTDAYGKGSKLAERANKLKRDQIDFIEEEAELERDINKLKEKIEDKEKYSNNERLQFVREVQALEERRANKKLSLAKEELAIAEETAALGPNTIEDNEEIARLKGNVIKTEDELYKRRKEAVTKEQELLNTIKAQNVAKQRAKDQANIEELEVLSATTVPVTFEASDTTVSNAIVDNFNKATASLTKTIKPVVVEIVPMVSSDQVIKDKILEIANSIKEALQDAMSSIGDVSNIFGGLMDIMSQSLANRSMELDNYYAKEKERIEGSRMSEEAKAAAITNLDKKVADKKKALAIKQAKMDKANAIFAAIVNTAAAITKALPNIPLALLSGAMGATQIATIAAAPLPKFQNGGIVGGSSYNGDKVLARVNSGEMILNQRQQGNLFNLLNGNARGGANGRLDIHVHGEFSGESIHLALREYERRTGIVT